MSEMGRKPTDGCATVLGRKRPVARPNRLCETSNPEQIVGPRVEVDVETQGPGGGEAEADDQSAADHPQ